ncbi:ABC transporter ATP-binding protein [Companilactobacillus metriopterae]|uniref:ABC transporter ATP-binding protein n=1 Tax=Companilactobacillus metriopterae TaxID=1909267 RepID=UPI00100B4F98|nr:ATP-binding cassette domain-containing protein [Companilactobacillus metriopterae]
MADQKEKIVEVKHLKQYFNIGKKNEVKAIDDVSFYIYKGETLGLVGESGSGKSTTGRSIIRLYSPTDGEILFEGQDISKIKNHSKNMKKFRKEMQMIFQDPYASLNPRMKVKDIISEGLDIHGIATGKEEREEKIAELLDMVNLNPEHMSRYPYEFSGGQRQRIGIARALAVDPQFIIADEPISALDVSIQAQVVNLLQDIQKERGLTYLFIAHDLSMVKYISDRIAVMYHGKIVELASADEIYDNPLHSYTKSLLSAIPIPDPETEKKRTRIDFDHSQAFTDQHSFREVLPGHFLYCTEEEAANIK